MAGAPLLIGIDAGTSVMKSVAFTTEGEQVAVAARKNNYVCVADGGVDLRFAEVDDLELLAGVGLGGCLPELGGEVDDALFVDQPFAGAEAAELGQDPCGQGDLFGELGASGVFGALAGAHAAAWKLETEALRQVAKLPDHDHPSIGPLWDDERRA